MAKNVIKCACCVLAVLLMYAVPCSALGMQSACAHSEIVVFADNTSVSDSVCTAVQSGLVFLGAIGLDFSGQLEIVLVQKMPEYGEKSSIGLFDSRNNEIRLLDYETVSNNSSRLPPSFQVRMNPAIWQSYIIHEITHAVVQHKFAAGVYIRAASEYIAVVAQIATLPPAMREEIIMNYPELSGFEKPDEITFGYYMLDPSRFTVNSYLHFSRPENGRLFIEKLLREGLSDD